MAITFQKQPLTFFNVNEPAIFEFTSDADLGVNPNDLVADLLLKSLYTFRTYTIKNIVPNYNTGVFRVDISGYLKSLMLDNFNFEFDSTNKRYSVEKFQIGVSVHAENGADTFTDEYVFDSGYIFDTTFIFAEQTPSDTSTEDNNFYPIMGKSQLSQKVTPQKSIELLNILGPKYQEFAIGFSNTLSIFVPDLPDTELRTYVGGVQSLIPYEIGVATAPISDAQIANMQLPTLITTTLNNPDIPVYGIAYRADNCEDILQFRFYNSYGGYTYFYSQKEAKTASRGKTEFINNDFYNAQELKSSRVQRSLEYKEQMALTGVKDLRLEEQFLELLRSPKVEVLLPRGFTECEVSGNYTKRKFDFEYTLNVMTANEDQIMA